MRKSAQQLEALVPIACLHCGTSKANGINGNWFFFDARQCLFTCTTSSCVSNTVCQRHNNAPSWQVGIVTSTQVKRSHQALVQARLKINQRQFANFDFQRRFVSGEVLHRLDRFAKGDDGGSVFVTHLFSPLHQRIANLGKLICFERLGNIHQKNGRNSLTGAGQRLERLGTCWVRANVSLELFCFDISNGLATFRSDVQIDSHVGCSCSRLNNAQITRVRRTNSYCRCGGWRYRR